MKCKVLKSEKALLNEILNNVPLNLLSTNRCKDFLPFCVFRLSALRFLNSLALYSFVVEVVPHHSLCKIYILFSGNLIKAR